MVRITADVEVDLEDFDTSELREELELRGYYISSDWQENLEDMDDRALIDELNSRGYTVYGKKADIPFELYQSFLLDDNEKFRQSVKKLLIENGYRP
jgi:hypothetical protein